MPVQQPPSFWRSPRLRSALPQEEVEIPAPPQRPSPQSSLIPTLLPAALTLLVMISIGLAAGNTNWLLFTVPMMLVSSVAAVVTYQWQKRSARQKTEERQHKYRKLLAEYDETFRSKQREQEQKLFKRDPDPERCVEWVSELRRGLWARAPGDDDYLRPRVGLGTRDSTVTIKVPEERDIFDPDPLIQDAQELAKRYAKVSRVPVGVDLREADVVGIAGPRKAILETVRAMVIQLATHHSPDELKIGAIYPHSEERDWVWMRWLPHVWTEDRKFRFLADKAGLSHQLLQVLDDLMDNNRNLLAESSSSSTPALPAPLVLLVADADQVEGDPIIQRLQAEGPSLGVYPVFLAPRVKALPRSCQLAVRVHRNQSYLFLIESMARQPFVPDHASPELAEQFARAMAPIRLKKQASPSDIPSTVTFLEMMNARAVEDLRVSSRWQRSQSASRSLAVPIGLKAGGEALIFDLHERAHGPNGLVAGMVGAGKSELLQTVVASMAVNYHPHRVAFVLVDYKGGGMAVPFAGLPHVLGMITNLQEGGLAVRALTSFQVELERRQRLFNAAEVSHIDAYQRKYYRGEVKEPLPYLVIIVDEFAEMKTERPEVAKEFVRIARLGRALGFRLILAMQKPAGIVDGQIEANTRFRMCLRVAQVEDSRAMLKRQEAAFLSGVGRAYFQVGVNEIFDLFQVAWSGAPYDPSGTDADDPFEIVRVDLDGTRTSLYRPPREGAQSAPGLEPPTQLRMVVDHMKEVAQNEGIEGLESPWLPPLPEQITLDDVRTPRGWSGRRWDPVEQWLQPIVGLLDNPAQRCQDPLELSLGKEGHLCVYGAPGYGTSTFVQTLAISLAMDHSPQDLHLYILDFGGRLLKMFEGLPHVGGVITADETERVSRLLLYLSREIERRKELFGSRGVANLVNYRAATGKAMPAIVVILDKYAAFAEAFEEADDMLLPIAREGGNLGIHLVLTAHSATVIRHKLGSNVTLAVALQLVESGEYSALVGRTDGLYPTPVPGRGLVKGKPVLEFQTALPAQGETDAQRSEALRSLMKQMSEAWDGATPYYIRTMPEVVALADLLKHAEDWPAADATPARWGATLGLLKADLQPCEVELAHGPNFIIAGPPQCGKTSLLQTWLLGLAERYRPGQVQLYLLDSRRGGLSPLRGLPHVKAYACDEKQASGLLDTLAQALEARRREPSSVRHAGQGSGGRGGVEGSPALVLAVDDIFDPSDDTLDEEAKTRLGTLARQGRRLGLFMLVSGSSMDLSKASYKEPIKTLAEAQTGFMLGVADDSVFNLRLSYRERDQILPLGEAYWTHRGQACRVKLATCHCGQLMLGEWVDGIARRSGK